MTTREDVKHHKRAADHQGKTVHHRRQASKHYQEKGYAHAAHQAQIASEHTNHSVQEANEAVKYHAEKHGDGILTPRK